MTVVGELPSGPDPEQLRVSPDGTLVFVANENDALLTAIDVKTRKAITQFPGRRRAGGRGGQPGRRRWSSTPPRRPAWRISSTGGRRKSSPTFSSPRVRASPNSSRTAPSFGCPPRSAARSRSSIRSRRSSRRRSAFEVPGLRKEADPAGRNPLHLRRQARLRRARARQPRRGHRRRDQGGRSNISSSASGSGTSRSRPDDKLLLTTNGVSNDVSVIDVGALKVLKSIAVGSYPWGVAITRR